MAHLSSQKCVLFSLLLVTFSSISGGYRKVYPPDVVAAQSRTVDLDEYVSPVDGSETPAEGAVTLAFVFDVTGSMWDDLVQVIDGADKILQTVLSRREGLLHNYVLVPFHDPEIGPATITTDHRVFQTQLRELYVQGGGDCPETSIGAIKLALELCLPNSFIYVFTDASSKDYYLLQDVLTLVQRKQIQVIFVMTGDCGEPLHPGHLAYETIASTSSGQVFHLVKSDVDQVLNFVRVSLQARKVNLLAVDTELEGNATLPLIVDSSLREFTVSLSGDNPQVELVNPSGNTINESTGAEELLNINNVRIVNVKEPEQGTWNVKLSSNSSHTVRATGLSSVDFEFGFSVAPTSNLQETYHRPLKGVKSYLVINATDLPLNADLESVELIGLSGEVLNTVPLNSIPGFTGFYNATPFYPPNEFFYLKIIGYDESGFPIQRISPTAVSSQLPGIPEVTIRIANGTRHGGTINFICHILSLVPFTLEWYRGENKEVLQSGPENYKQTSEVAYTIHDANMEHEDHYSCLATNIAGSGSATVFLDIKDPPPFIKKMQDRTFHPGSTASLTCVASSSAPMNITWSRYDQSSSRRRFVVETITSNPRAKDYGNGTLIITDIRADEEGWYRCTAQNEGGQTHQKIYLSVQKTPVVTVTPSDVTFSRGASVTLTCRSSGSPEPNVEWLRNGQLVLSSSSINVNGETLTLVQATHVDAGDFECRATNAAGSDSKIIHVKYVEPPVIHKGQDHQIAILGDLVTLSCTGNVGIPAGRIYWRRGNESLPRRRNKQNEQQTKWNRGDLPIEEAEDDDDQDYFFDDDKFEALDSGVHLRFRPDMSDAGEFVCEAKNDAGSDVHTITLMVYVPPTINPTTDNWIKILRGQNLSLSCLASGYPTPKISWAKDGVGLLEPPTSSDHSVTDNTFTNDLIIPNISVDSTGIYTCIANNEAGTAIRKTDVYVLDSPVIDKTTQPLLESNMGSDVSLPCSAFGHPPPVITWSRDGVILLALDTSKNSEVLQLLLPNVNASSTGTYTCTAMNEAGTDQININLQVLVPPSVESDDNKKVISIVDGKSVTMTCPIGSLVHPLPTINWEKNGMPLSREMFGPTNFRFGNGRLSLIIESVNIIDSGDYRCIATNSAGEADYVFSLDVLVGPTFEVDSYEDSIAVIKGSSLSLDCTSIGNPRPTTTWSRFVQSWRIVNSDERIDANHSNQLKIKSIDEMDSGLYSCTIENEVGVAKRVFNVTVLVPPSIDGLDYELLKPLKGELLELSCPVSGNPAPVIAWTKNGAQLTPSWEQNKWRSPLFIDNNSSIRFERISEDDSGKYGCEATNQAGRISKSFHLDVFVPPTIQNSSTFARHQILNGSNIQLLCVADGNPTPEVEWKKDGLKLVISDDDVLVRLSAGANGRSRVSLRLGRVDHYDSGIYVCTATNAAGRQESSAIIEVTVPPYFETFSNMDPVTKAETHKVPTGSPVILNCPVLGTPTPVVKWLRDGRPLAEDAASSNGKYDVLENGLRLRISVTRPADAITFACIGTNEGGTAERQFQIDVLVPPSIQTPRNGRDGSSIISAIQGEQLIITCPAEGNPPPEISWFLDGRPIGHPEFPRVTFEPRTNNLILNRLQAADRGRYTCVATNSVGSTEKDFDVDILVLPTLDIPLDKLDVFPFVRDNRPVTFHCPVSGYPEPNIMWLKDGKSLDPSSDSNIVISSDERRLKLIRSHTSDEGVYTCLAFNDAGDTSVNFTLQVQIPPKIESERIQTKFKAKENGTIILECPITAHPQTVIMWLKDGDDLTDSKNVNVAIENGNQKLTLSNLSSAAAGIYTCVASNEAGATEQNYKVDVQVPPKLDSADSNPQPTVVLNRATTLICPTIGSPLPAVKWFKDGQLLHRHSDPNFSLSVDGRRLKLRRARAEDTGLYKCIAFNDAGKTERDFHLTVQVPPKIVQKNTGGEGDGTNSEAVEGGTAEMLCEVLGTPEPTIIWLKEGRWLDLISKAAANEAANRDTNTLEIIDSPNSLDKMLAVNISTPQTSHMQLLHNGQLLRIHNVAIDDAGRYTCVASNWAGSVEKDYDLDVLVPPRIAGSTFETISALLNRAVILECPIEPVNPPPSVVWLKDDRPLNLRRAGGTLINIVQDGRQLHFPRIMADDSGRYTCIATNIVGRQEKHYDVDVQVPPTITSTNSGFVVIRGEDVILECLAGGNPKPNIIWLKDGHLLFKEGQAITGLTLQDSNQRLVVNNTLPKHAGRFTCIVSNDAGTTEKDILLDVVAPPTMAELTLAQRFLSVMISHPVKIECPVTSDNGLLVSWSKNGVPLNATVEDPFLRLGSGSRILELIRSRTSDEGLYQCVAANSAGKSQSDFKLEILVPPRIESPLGDHDGPTYILENHAADFECYVSGNPTPTVKWMKDGQVISDLLIVKRPDGSSEKMNLLANGQHLHIESAALSDSGQYKCVASSSSGTRERDYYLTVQAPPKIDPATKSEEVATLHYPVTLQCLVISGSPEPTIAWMRNGVPLDLLSDPDIQITNKGHLLHILRSKLTYAGKYTCLASNTAGSDNFTTSLDIHVIPTIDRSNIGGKTTVIADQTLTLECPASGHPSPTIQWIKNGQPIVEETQNSISTSNISGLLNQQHKIQLLFDGKLLRVSNAQVSEEGIYQCIASNKAGQDQTEHIVDVVVRPTIDNSAVQPSLKVLEGNEISLLCPISGDPQPSIVWLKDGQVFSAHHHPNWDISSNNRNQQNVSSIRLIRAHSSDSGHYSCLGTNIAGDAELHMDLEVFVPPTIAPDPDTAVVNQIEGYSLILECNPRGHPMPEVRWTRNGSQIVTEESAGNKVISSRSHHQLLYNNHRLRIEGTTVQDSGAYICIAESLVGSAEHRFQLEILAPPRMNTSLLEPITNIILNENAALVCPVSGIPHPSIVWYKESQLLFSAGHLTISHGGTKLVFSKTRLSDKGRYICLATNDAGTAETDMILNVLVPPTIEGEENLDPELHVVVVDQALTLECHIRGFPPPIVTWFKHDEPLTNDSSTRIVIGDGGRSLRINRAMPEDDDTYSCFAENDAGGTEKSFRVDVLVPPGVDVQQAKQSLQFVLGHPLSIECSNTGDPPPVVTWLKNGHPLRNSEQSTIIKNGTVVYAERITLSHAGDYTCMATNEAGTSEQEFNVRVLVPPEIPDNDKIHNISTIAYHPIRLECPAQGNPVPKILWSKDDQRINSTLVGGGSDEVRSASGPKLQFFISHPDQGGIYICEATNIAGSQQKVFNISVWEPPSFVNDHYPSQQITRKVGDDLTLSCPAEGYPRPQISWYQDDQPLLFTNIDTRYNLQSDNQELSLRNISVDQNGRYRCVVANVAGNISKQFEVSILVPPSIRGTGNSNVTAIINERVDLPCQANGVPAPRITWSRARFQLVDAGSGHMQFWGDSLTFPQIKIQDAGVYTCTATNNAGSVSYNITLEVQVPPTISDGPSDIAVINGANALLPCLVKGRPPPSVFWKRDTELVTSEHGFALQSDGSLFIGNAQLGHAGTFTCVATNTVGSKTVQRHLRVHVSPQIKPNQPEQYTAIRGEDTVLECKSDGHPPPQTTWELRGQPVDLGNERHALSSDGSLKISSAQPSDMGSYKCSAQNVAGSDIRDVELLVLVPPKIKRGLYQDKLVVMEGKPLHLSCRTEGYPLPSVSWSSDGIRLTTEQNGEMWLEQVKIGDAGKYVCIATNEAGRDYLEIQVDVHQPPAFVTTPTDNRVTVGSTAELVCHAIGAPLPTVTWLHNSATVNGAVTSANGRTTLILNNVQVEDSGTYTCVASNPSGELKSAMTFSVLVPPKITHPPGDVVAAHGTTVILMCDAEGDPQPDIIWTKDGHRLERSPAVSGAPNEGWLVLEKVQAADTGNYKCIASSAAGNAVAAATLAVLVEPKFLIKPENTVVDSGESVIFDCLAEGNPEPVISWLKDGYPLHQMDNRLVVLSNSSFQLTAALVLDEGNYECEASSELNSIRAQAQLLVRVHGMWSSWGEWGICSSSCGQGTQLRHRQCNNPQPRQSGLPCTGPSQEIRKCIIRQCPVDGGWSEWWPWEDCSATCGQGIRSRIRRCDSPIPSHGGSPCQGDSRTFESCFVKECPVDGFWMSWTPWSTCSESCGNGVQTRSRLCQSPRHGGKHCVGEHQETTTCNLSACQVNGQWSIWSSWSLCSQSCGGGVRLRSRQCDSPAPSGDGRACSGESTQRDYCKNDQCPVHGSWGAWTSWGDCSASCNGGQRRRFRSCNSPSPSLGGRICSGSDQDTEVCNAHRCQEHGNWASWSDWSSCSATCGRGTRDRHRSCSSPTPRFGGRRCFGDATQVEECYLRLCTGLPKHSVGNLLGVINGIDIGLSPIESNISLTGDHTTITATVGNLVPESGNWMSVLPSILSQAYWSFATEIGQAANGYSLTKGYFHRETQVSFMTGETVQITQVARGLDSTGSLIVDVVVSGDVPDIPSDAEIILDPYTEDYIQTGSDTMYAISSRTFSVNGYTLPYAWNHSLRYDDDNGQMPFLIQQLYVDGLNATYDSSHETLHFSMASAISKGTPSNKCPTGFTLHSNGQFCADIDECSATNPCSHLCANTLGSFTCVCPKGFILGPDGINCQDMDECQLSIDDCLPNTKCENTLGSFRCLATCEYGYQRTQSGLECQDVDECSNVTPPPCDQVCFNFIGGYRCDCRQGYQLFGKSSCIDTDECEKKELCSHGCQNTHGSFRCTCPVGFNLLDDTDCEDEDECANGNHNCRLEQNCINVPGSFLCSDTCSEGHTVNSNGTCIDINECQLGIALCHHTQQCENLPGSYRCSCPQGYQATGPGKTCKDYNECTTKGRCQHQCENTIGSFRCHCPNGYRVSSNGRTCQDIDECAEEEINCGLDKICFNTRGSYRCMDAPCPPLYAREKLTGDCVLPCDRSDTPCLPGVKYAEILSYKMVSLASGIEAYEDLVRLVAYDTDEQPLPNTQFSIADNESGVPLQVRQESGRGILYTLKALDPGLELSIIALATSYNPTRTAVHYTTKFIIFLSIADYPY